MQIGDVSAMQRASGDTSKGREEAIAHAIQSVAAELRLIDVTDLIGYILAEKHGNIGDLVRSSTELFFKDDTLRYGSAASVDLTWGNTPTIRLDLEFRHMGVWVYFGLILSALRASVDMYHIEFADADADPQENTRQLIAAIQDARITPIKSNRQLFQ